MHDYQQLGNCFVCRQKLCPALIHILANPLADKTLLTKSASVGPSVGCSAVGNTLNEEVGRGSGCSGAAPSLMSSSAKAIYRYTSAL